MISRQQQIPTRSLTLIFRCNPSSLEDFSPLQICFNSQAKQKTRIYVGIDFVSGDEHKSKKIELCSLLEVCSTENNSPFATRKTRWRWAKGKRMLRKNLGFTSPKNLFRAIYANFDFVFIVFTPPKACSDCRTKNSLMGLTTVEPKSDNGTCSN